MFKKSTLGVDPAQNEKKKCIENGLYIFGRQTTK